MPGRKPPELALLWKKAGIRDTYRTLDSVTGVRLSTDGVVLKLLQETSALINQLLPIRVIFFISILVHQEALRFPVNVQRQHIQRLFDHLVEIEPE